ncbi:MAG: hypothetical protein WCG95_08850 [bacterium]
MNRERLILVKNILELFLDRLLEFPLWVKQIIYLRLYRNLSLSLSEDFIHTKEENIFHLDVPVLSFAGRTELNDRKNGLDVHIYNFLANTSEGLNMLEVSMNNFWTMEEVAKCYIFCLEQNYIKAPESIYIYSMAGFMAGTLRTGEYFKRIGKINVDQLEQTIIKQNEYAAKKTPHKMAEIMISLGFITEKDISSLLIIKEEAKKRFILDFAIIPKEITGEIQHLKNYQAEIDKLTEQNNLLKAQLSKILAFVKKK